MYVGNQNLYVSMHVYIYIYVSWASSRVLLRTLSRSWRGAHPRFVQKSLAMSVSYVFQGGFQKLGGPFSASLYLQEPTYLGSILGPLIFGNSPMALVIRHLVVGFGVRGWRC